MTRRAHSLLEIVVASAVAAVVLGGALAGLKVFTRPAAKSEVTLDQLRELSLGAESLDRDLREARQIIYPAPGGAPARVLYLREFSGSIVVWYYSASLKHLRRAQLDLSGLPTEARKPAAAELDGAWFSVSPNGLVSWALFSPGRMLMGSVRRVNQ